VTGTKKLVQDATVAIQAIGALVCVLFAIYFLARKAGADEQDQKIWKNRLTISIVSAVGIVTIAGIIGMLTAFLFIGGIILLVEFVICVIQIVKAIQKPADEFGRISD